MKNLQKKQEKKCLTHKITIGFWRSKLRLMKLLACTWGLGLAAFSSVAYAEIGVSDSQILLGQSADLNVNGLTGQAITFRDGALLYFDSVNQASGIYGRKIKLISLDDNNKSLVQSAENTRKLIHDEKVFALTHYTDTAPSMQAMIMAEKANVPFFSPNVGAEEFYAYRKNVFTFRASFKDELRRIIRHLATLKIDRIAIVYNDLNSGKVLLAQANELLAVENLKLVSQGMMKFNSNDPTDAVRAVAKGAPKAIIIGVSGKDAAAFVHKMKQQPGIPPIFYARSIINPKTLFKELGTESYGIAVTQIAPNPFNPITLIAKEYRTRLAEKNTALAAEGKPQIKPEYSGFEGFISAKILVEGMRRAGKTLTRERLIDAIESIHEWDLGGYIVGFSKKNHNGSGFADITMIGSNGRTVD
ncbi:ABC transporter substrate-binding protein [Undibacterium sp. TS12]|uniref:ABC transporter substrate-binding protein n=1 Tax=Undibacterium sp. TS12 TaxID=2908202 RepID=UPI001F4D213D|nr:ABC transporter substrate-binding protein [Undibacterium sp. TS12]MCH8620538.1 ABC transporter substrate-binding protein [Undibacterium sp. TS12]